MGRLKQAGLVWPTLFACAGVLTLLGLGSWQVQRLHWKRELITRIEQRAGATPVTLEAALARWERTRDVEYLRVRLGGRLDHDKERHLYALVEGRVGWRIVTPLVTDGGRIVLVDRGFVPDGLKLPETRRQGQVETDIVLTGLARAPETQRLFTPDNDVAPNIWYWRDVVGMAASALEPPERARVAPFFVESEAAPVPGGWPKGGVTRLELPNRHLGYALTWYGLAGALVVVYGFFARGRLADS